MQLTTNTTAFIESQQYSSFIVRNLHDGLLPETFYRNIGDFMHGDTLNLKTIGSVTLQEASEDTALVYSPIETGTITFSITEYVGDAWYITDDLREDGNQIEALTVARAAEQTRALQEKYESDFLKAAAAPYSAATTGMAINGFNHFIVSAETNNVISINHMIDMKVAFDKGNVPSEGRVLIVDPVVEATLNKLISIGRDITPWAVSVLERGLATGQRFLANWFGWDVMTSNRLFQGAANDGTTTLSSAVFNIFMCVLDDQHKPLMGAWRRHPKVEGERNMNKARDDFTVRSRYGWGLQRIDTLGCVATSPTSY